MSVPVMPGPMSGVPVTPSPNTLVELLTVPVVSAISACRLEALVVHRIEELRPVGGRAQAAAGKGWFPLANPPGKNGAVGAPGLMT